MSYKPNLGIIGNIERNERLVREESSNRTVADTDNREAVEQSITDNYLDHIASEQYMTDLELRIIELEGK